MKEHTQYKKKQNKTSDKFIKKKYISMKSCLTIILGTLLDICNTIICHHVNWVSALSIDLMYFKDRKYTTNYNLL
jgi:hypothetical protein